MKFDMTRPCDNCPFRTDVVPFLRPARAAEIAYSLVKEGLTFTCHKTIDYDNLPEDEDGEPVHGPQPSDQHCAGAAIMLERMRRPNQLMRVASRLGLRDADKLDMDSPVYPNAEAFVTAHIVSPKTC